jgi:hypothetical protein
VAGYAETVEAASLLDANSTLFETRPSRLVTITANARICENIDKN